MSIGLNALLSINMHEITKTLQQFGSIVERVIAICAFAIGQQGPQPVFVHCMAWDVTLARCLFLFTSHRVVSGPFVAPTGSRPQLKRGVLGLGLGN
jgi:hypothetical protein